MIGAMPEIKIFIIPRGRTGGTLLATMLNAHRQISMGYELYPDKLSDERGAPYAIEDLIQRLRASAADEPEQWLNRLERSNFRTFCARATLRHPAADFARTAEIVPCGRPEADGSG
jgi:hypothetical protein